MLGGYASAAALALSGIAAIVVPDRVAAALDSSVTSARGRAELRITYACFAALGIFALAAGDTLVFKATGALWLGAAVVRVLSLALDRPRPDRTYWALLALEVSLGLAGLLGSG
jgi:hypothetical protein